MQNRRDFLRTGSVGLLGLFASSIPMEATADNYSKEKVLDRSEWSWSKIQKQFTIDKKINYLNNGTMGLSPDPVIDAVVERMKVVNSKGQYSGEEATLLVKLANLLHCNKGEIAITTNVSEGINIAAWSLPLKTGDEVILTNHEHVGNALPWLNRARKDGLKIVMLELPSTQEECLQRLEDIITPKTKVIAVPHITCTTGQILPIKEICQMAQKKGIKTFIDGAHGIGLLNLDLHDMGCDIYSSCGHKWLLGPKGTGILYARQELIQELDPHFVGGHSDTGWTLDHENPNIKGFQETSHRFFYGTHNSALYSGLIAAVDFMESIGMSRVEERIKHLNNELILHLQPFSDKFDILTPTEPASRAGILSIKLKGDTRKFYDDMRSKGWILRYVPESDLHCIRISTHIYNSESQVRELAKLIGMA